MTQSLNTTLGVLGGGNMAEALLRGILSSGLISPENIHVYDIVPARRTVFENLGCSGTATPSDALSASIVLIAVKPQNIREALSGVTGRANQLFISIVAGVPTQVLSSLLGTTSRIIRVMPNTPLLTGKGMSALCRGENATADDMDTAMSLFRCGGDAVEVGEDAMDAVTALSGSGPAYIFRFAEALFAAGESMGLPAELAQRLTIGMIYGAAEMLNRGPDAATLRRKVTSPGGTTAAALDVFEKNGFEQLVKTALTASKERSIELGRGQ